MNKLKIFMGIIIGMSILSILILLDKVGKGEHTKKEYPITNAFAAVLQTILTILYYLVFLRL